MLLKEQMTGVYQVVKDLEYLAAKQNEPMNDSQRNSKAREIRRTAQDLREIAHAIRLAALSEIVKKLKIPKKGERKPENKLGKTPLLL